MVGETIDAADAHALGRAFGTVVAESGGYRVCVGFDGRLSSPELERAVIEGLNACGVDAIRIGLGPTPMMYYGVHALDADDGVLNSFMLEHYMTRIASDFRRGRDLSVAWDAGNGAAGEAMARLCL